MQEQNQVKSLMQVRSGLDGIGAQNEFILYACYTKLNQPALYTTKSDEKFAMLIPKVVIHSNVNPSPKAFVSAACVLMSSRNIFAVIGLCMKQAAQFGIQGSPLVWERKLFHMPHCLIHGMSGCGVFISISKPIPFQPIISKNIRILGRVTSFFGTHGLDVGSFWRPESSTCPPAAATYAGVKNEGIFQAKSKSNLAGPKAALGKQKKCQICQSFIVEGEAAKSRFINIK